MLCQEELAKSKPLTLCGTGGERTTSPEKGPAIPRAGRGQPPEGTRRLSPLLVLFAQGGGAQVGQAGYKMTPGWWLSQPTDSTLVAGSGCESR